MSWPPTKEEWEKLKLKALEPPEPPVRYVSPKMYDVLSGMVSEGLISGHPYSELATEATCAEFFKRMKDVK